VNGSAQRKTGKIVRCLNGTRVWKISYRMRQDAAMPFIGFSEGAKLPRPFGCPTAMSRPVGLLPVVGIAICPCIRGPAA
jgi:hypothetical protein